MNKLIEQMEDEIMGKCLDELLLHVSKFTTHFAIAVKVIEDIKALPCHSPEMKERLQKDTQAPLGMFRECLKAMGGIPALVKYEKEGEGLLSNCIVIPTNENNGL